MVSSITKYITDENEVPNLQSYRSSTNPSHDRNSLVTTNRQTSVIRMSNNNDLVREGGTQTLEHNQYHTREAIHSSSVHAPEPAESPLPYGRQRREHWTSQPQPWQLPPSASMKHSPEQYPAAVLASATSSPVEPTIHSFDSRTGPPAVARRPRLRIV